MNHSKSSSDLDRGHHSLTANPFDPKNAGYARLYSRLNRINLGRRAGSERVKGRRKEIVSESAPGSFSVITALQERVVEASCLYR
ncbi:MAG: hypothetical protein ACLP5H_16375 [Desulfomonilaceae bacterium]